MMCSTFSASTAYCSTDRQFRSECTTRLAMFRCTNTSPGSRPRISLAGTRLSAQPIQRYFGDCWRASRVKNSGSASTRWFTQARLFANRLSRLHIKRSHRLAEQLTPDQHAADLASAGADLVQLGIAPQPRRRVFVDVAVAAQHLDRLAGHPGRLL